MTWPIVVLVVVASAIALIVPGLRASLFNALATVAWALYGLSRRLLGRGPGWLATAAGWLTTAATATGGFVVTAARIIGWSLAGLTLFLVVAIWTANLTVLTVIAILLGTLILIFPLTPLSIFTPPVVDGIPLDRRQRMKDAIGMWVLTLYWIAILMLFLPTITSSVSATAVTIVLLCASILKIANRFNWFRKILVGSTVVIMVVVIATSTIAPLRQYYLDLRFNNVNSMLVADTDERIAELYSLEVRYGGLSAADKAERADLIRKRERQQAAATAAANRRPRSSWSLPSWDMPSLPRMRDKHWAALFLFLALVAIAIKPKSAGGHGHH